jgi:hypothetical protein
MARESNMASTRDERNSGRYPRARCVRNLEDALCRPGVSLDTRFESSLPSQRVAEIKGQPMSITLRLITPCGTQCGQPRRAVPVASDTVVLLTWQPLAVLLHS